MKYETREKALLVELVSGYMANMVGICPIIFPTLHFLTAAAARSWHNPCLSQPTRR
jgi:hypothetical protein